MSSVLNHFVSFLVFQQETIEEPSLTEQAIGWLIWGRNHVFICLTVEKPVYVLYNGMLVPVRTRVDLRRRNEQHNELYQLKVDVGMLNTVKIY